MSLSKSKSFLTGVLLVILSAVTGSAMALDGMRLWKPYQPETFGGGRRSNDGTYGSVEAILWKVSPSRNLVQLSDVLNVTDIDSNFRLGTRVTFGNQRGHHGWRFSGYGISGLGGNISQSGQTNWDNQGNRGVTYCGIEEHEFYDPDELRTRNHRYYVDWINFETAGQLVVRSRTSIIDLNLDWTYRTHPLSWGDLEFSAGVKYWDFRDKLSFSNSSIKHMYTFRYTEDPMDDGEEDPEGMTSVLSYTPQESTYYNIRQARNRTLGPNIGFNLTRRNNRWAFGAGASVILGVNNQSFSFAEYSEELTGISEDVTESEYADLDIEALRSYRDRSLDAGSATEGGMILGTQTRYHRNRTVFSPGVGLQLSATWQWTDAVGVKFGFDSTLMDNVARGSDLVATPRYVNEMGSDGQPVLDANGTVSQKMDGYDFSLRSKGDTVLLYGVNVGLVIKR